MKIYEGTYAGERAVTVRLSERNLQTLNELWAAALEQNALPVLHRFDVSENTLVSVVIEPDEIHYRNREASRGGLS